MSLAAEADLPLEDLLARQRALVTQLRDVEHWRRLAEARLDLAIAAVTDIDELAGRPLPCPGQAPYGLRTLVGIPDLDDALPEAAVLLQIRAALVDLENYAGALRESCTEVSRQVLDQLDAEGNLQTYCRTLSDGPADQQPIRRAVTRRPRSSPRMGRTTARRSPSVIRAMPTTGDSDRR